MSPIYHIGLYKFKATLSASSILASTANMLLLKEKCLHPSTGKPYILDMVAGPNLVPESLYGGGYTHALVMTFACKEDWLYYTQKDPAHTEFIQTNKDWESGCVFDVGGNGE
jgi:hypothetical protein